MTLLGYCATSVWTPATLSGSMITEASVSVPTLLTPAKAAEVLGVGVKTLERWRSQGDGPQFVKLSASTVRYRAVDLNAFVIQRLKSNTLQ